MAKIRESNMELLRIVAMFLVLLVHADFFSLGGPTGEDCVTKPMDAFLRVLFQAYSISCVNIFVCLSGWFGIQPKLKSISSFIFQCLFWLIGLYVFTLIIGTSEWSVNGIKGCFVLTPLNWFIKAYLLLYILSPVLNAFVAHTSRAVFKKVLVFFFLFEWVYGWLFYGAATHIQDGYSTISFVGLYLLARYFRLYQPWAHGLTRSRLLAFCTVTPVLVAALFVTPPHVRKNYHCARWNMA